MKFYSEKGYTGVDIAISVIVIFIFVSLISFLIYRFNSSAKEVELKSEATSIAVEEIEKVKQDDKNGNSLENQKVENKEGFFKTIIVQDYADLDNNSEKIPNLVKKVTVKISYMFQAKEQSVELSTILSKEN